jgi:ubiquinone/menaquinone biosynthesis C-methylase UbiE
MKSKGNTDAVYDDGRIRAQDQAALTIIQGTLDDPNLSEFKWLDLACGKGQMIAQLDKNLTENARAKIIYFGYDRENSYLKTARRKTDSLNLKNAVFEVGEIHNFANSYPEDAEFDFISLTNTVHEISPHNLASILYEAALRLSNKGSLFIYDMESLPTPELGAVPWRRHEVAEIIKALLDGLGVQGYEPAIAGWTHRTCSGWSLQLIRRHLNISQETIKKNKAQVILNTRKKIEAILNRKYDECKKALESLTYYQSETSEETAAEANLLYDFWALSRAIEGTR